MYLDLNGPDFIRVQQGPNVRQADALHPDVMFSGNYDDGSCMFFQLALNNGSAQVSFGRTLPYAPLVFGTLRLTQTLNQSGRVFNEGEYIMANAYRKQAYNQVPSYNCLFAFGATTTTLFANTTGFVGVASFMVVDN